MEKIRRIQEEFDEWASYMQRVILDYLYLRPAAGVFNPFIQHGRTRPVGALGHQSFRHQSVRSTQRHLSQFEHVKNSLRPVRRCGNCGKEVNTRRRCQQPLPNPAGTALVPLNDIGAKDKWKYLIYPPNVYE